MRLRNSEIVTPPKFYTVRFVRVVEGGWGGGIGSGEETVLVIP